MPTLLIDQEQADLIEVAITMLEAALTARVVRVDPDQIISNSLILQAGKLKTVRALMKAGEPPEFWDLEDGLRRKVVQAMLGLVEAEDRKTSEVLWRLVRSIAIAPAFPIDG